MLKLTLVSTLVGLFACGADTSSFSEEPMASSDALAGTPGPNQEAPVSEIIHSDDDAFACEPNVVHLWNMVTRVSLHTSMPLAQVDADTVIVFGAIEDGITPSSVVADSLGNMIVRLATEDLVPALTVGETMLTIEGAHRDGTLFSVSGILEVTE